MKNFLQRAFPLLVLALGLSFSASFLVSALSKNHYAEGFDMSSYATLPVQAGGRLKPMDSFARNNLLLLSGKTRLKLPDGTRLSAIEWLMDVQMRPAQADSYPVFRIDNDQVLGALGWEQHERTYFSYIELEPFAAMIISESERISAIERPLRSVFEEHMLKLGHALVRYHALGNYALPALIPPAKGEPQNHWHSLLDIIQSENSAATLKRPAVLFYLKLIESYHAEEPEPFNATVAGLETSLREYNGTGKVHAELHFNRLNPFFQSKFLYVGALVIALISWLAWSEPLRRSAVMLVVLSFLIHSIGLAARIYIQGRPPVTNLYSSAIFVGWGAVLLGIALEIFHKNGIGSAVAALAGFATLLIAPALNTGADTMEMMQAVLDSNFWLATHVVIISLGYSAMFVAGFLALVYILRGVFTCGLTPATARSLGRMVYAIICFAMLFSFVGTMLGGIWADQSWGRFWGWDPKENGALLIVLWCAIILHARWGRLCGERGLMLMTVAGNIVTSWSWFGTNMLGVGLHSYGFADKQFLWLAGFIFSQLFALGLGAFPRHYWRSAKALGTAGVSKSH